MVWAKTLKEKLHKACEAHIDKRLQTVENTMLSIRESLQSETKSSVGDKHETGRAMLQMEREKVGQQLAETQKTKEALAKININNSSEKISLGSVVYTTRANYYLAISAGEIKISNEIFYAISPKTPIGQLLLSKTTGEVLTFRNETFTIKKVL